MDEADSLAGCAVIGRKAGREAAGTRLSGIPKTDKGGYTYFVSGLVAFPFCVARQSRTFTCYGKEKGRLE
ncbi:hypothetical protein ACNR9V_08735 [Parageobacillus thermoglucosidasius]|uniref:hypothetical protein n=1 Tax=Parageobacillus thermoglucosidasius TaxID=1426 RepID=UPI003B677D84